MKKAFYLLVLTCGVSLCANAQEKGRVWLGGSINFSSEEEVDYRKVSGFSLNPEIGYAFSDRWAAGVRLQYGKDKTKYEASESNDSDYKSVGISPFVRHTCLTWKGFGIFVDGGLTYQHAEREQLSSGNPWIDITANYYGVFIAPGFSLRLTNAVSLIGQLNFFNASYQKSEYEYRSGSSTPGTMKYYTANIISPFNLDNFTFGFNVKF